jgi:tRNA (guanine-N7-)-methyltransferase
MQDPFLNLSRLSWPADWPKLFGRDAPLLLEIGFGGGGHLVELARRNPSSNVVGIEISLPSLRRGAKKGASAALPNLRVLQGDSRAALWLLFPLRSIHGVTINFPDPWPKAAHHNRRLISERFLHLLATRMAAGANLDIATDHEDYALVIEQALRASPNFDSRIAGAFAITADYRKHTKYEKTALAEGRVPRYFPWKRNGQPAANSFLIPEETAVPHVVLLSSMSLDEIGSRFTPFHVKDENIHIKYLDMLRSLGMDLLLVDVYISEEPYHQRIGLAVRRRQAGDMVISLHETGFPRPTPGVHLAVRHLAAWLQSQDPGATIINGTLMEAAGSSGD